MAILNYSTSIATEKTALEMQKKLVSAKAKAVLTEYDDAGVMVSISFRILTPYGMIMFNMPVNVDGVYKTLCKDTTVPRRFKTREQAARVAWRIIKDWVLAQLALVEAGQAEISEVFLAYAQNPDTGMTVYQGLRSNNFKQLTSDS